MAQLKSGTTIDGYMAYHAGNLPLLQATATRVVAAHNSSAAGRAGADYVCTGRDDQVQINQALASLGDAGGRVLLLEGSYHISSSITPASRTTLQGQGPATIIRPTGSAGYIIYLYLQEQVVLKDFRIEGWSSDGTMQAGTGIFANKVGACLFEALQINAPRYNGISMEGFGLLRGAGNRINACQLSNTGTGIGIRCRDTLVCNSQFFWDQPQSPSMIGISIGSSGAFSAIVNCLVRNCSTAISVGASGVSVIGTLVNQGNAGISLSSVGGCSIAGNLITGATGGLLIYGGYNLTISDNVIDGTDRVYCRSDDSVITGNVIRRSREANEFHGARNSIANNIFFMNGREGAKIFCSDSVVTGNQFTDNSADAANSYAQLSAQSNHTMYAHNYFRRSLASPWYGMSIPSSAYTGNVVLDNHFVGGGVSGNFYDAGTGTITTNGNRQ